MKKQKLLLFPSTSMQNNKKAERNENTLIRMASSTRASMGLEDSEVETWASEEVDVLNRVNNATMLKVFKAFTKDIKKVKKLVEDGELPFEELDSVGFVTPKIYKSLVNKNKEHKDFINVWVSKGIIDVVLGADPEFILRDKDSQIIHANSVLSHYAPIGSDGAMAEFRPKPATNSLDLVSNIKELMTDQDLTAGIKEYDWLAGIYYKNAKRDFPIGGHIHIGSPLKLNKLSAKQKITFFSICNKILDELLAVPLVRLDGLNGTIRRTASVMGKYGFFGEYRVCNGRLEYRTLSGLWLSHPKIAKAVIGTAQAIMESIYTFVENKDFATNYLSPNLNDTKFWHPTFDEWKGMELTKDMQCVVSSKQMLHYLHEGTRQIINKPFLNTWAKKMRALPTYNKYSEDIEHLISLVHISAKDVTNLNMDLKENWLEEKELLVQL